MGNQKKEEKRSTRYTQEFRDDCIKYYLNHPEKSLNKTSASLGVPMSTLAGWMRSYQKDSNPNSSTPKNRKKNNLDNDIILELKLEIKRYKKEVEILKSTLKIFIND
jgi:transposase